jgi:carbamoyl-phosphate synthase large subunit
MSKLLLILGGGSNQLPIVKTARDIGIRTLVSDLNIVEECKSLADHTEKADITDKHAILEMAQRYKIDAVLADQNDLAVPTAAYVAENLGLRGIGYEVALRFTNKFLMRQSLKDKLPFNVPAFSFFDDINLALNFCKGNNHLFDYIVKPINSQGSKGVTRLNSQDYEEMIRKTYHESHQRGILIEQYIPGYEYSVEAFTENGMVHNLAVTKKYHYDSNSCLDEKNTWLGDISTELEQELFDLNKKIIHVLGLSFGITHAEFKVNNGKPYLMEIAARGGGGSISNKVIPYLTGFEPAKNLICNLLGMPCNIQIQDYKSKFAILKFFSFEPGKVKKLHVNRKAIDDLIEFQLDIKDGDIIKPVLDSRDRCGYFIIRGENRQALLDKEKWVLESVIVEYEK